MFPIRTGVIGVGPDLQVWLLEKADEASMVALEAFAAGDMVTGIAAIQLAAQLLQLARIWERTHMMLAGLYPL